MTLSAVLLALLVATGGAFTWGRERHTRSFREHLPDRIPQLIWAGLFFLAIYAWPIYYIYVNYLVTLGSDDTRHPPLWVWLCLILAVFMPGGIGWLYGLVGKKGLQINGLTLLKGQPTDSPEWDNSSPTSFDYITGQLNDQILYVLCSRDNQPYVIIGRLRHASATPYGPDLYLGSVFFCDREEAWISFIASGDPLRTTESGCWVPGNSIVFVQVYPGHNADSKDADDPEQAQGE